MKLTKAMLVEWRACSEGVEWYGDADTTVQATLARLSAEKKTDWAVWLIQRTLTHQELVEWVCWCAEQCLPNFEKAFPEDNRPRAAIAAARKWANDPTDENKSAAYSAADSAADSAYSAYSAARSAARSAADSAAIDYAISLISKRVEELK